MFVEELRKVLTSSTPTYTLTAADVPTDILTATTCTLSTKFVLSDKSGYKNYTCWDILYFYQNRKLGQIEYISLLAGLVHKSPGSTSISFMDRKDLIDYLTGASKESERIKTGDVVNQESILFGFDLGAKRAALPAGIEENLRTMKRIFAYQRTINTCANVLCVKGSKTFHNIEKPAFSAFADMKNVKKLGSSAKIEAKRQPPSKKSSKRKAPEESAPKIIIIPSGAQSLLTLYNVNSFLVDQKFVPSEEIRAQGVKKPQQVIIERDAKTTKHTKFLILDSIDTLTPSDWVRVVAVFATGQEWQFATWPVELREPVVLFSKVLGFSLRFVDEPVGGGVGKWNVKGLGISRSKRYLDSMVVHSFWKDLDKFLAQKYTD